MRPLLGALALSLLGALAPATTFAQYRIEAPAVTPPEADMLRARELYAEGGRSVEEGRWADAFSAFEESFRLSGVPAALFNAATTLRSMGRHRDARDLFTQLLASEGLDEETRGVAEARRREEAARVSHISLTGLGDASDARVELDGASVERPVTDPLPLEADPGAHAVSVIRAGFVPWREELRLGDGEIASLHVSLTAIEREEAWQSPILWTLVGVVLAAGAVVTAVVLHDQAQLSPRPMFDDLVVELE